MLVQEDNVAKWSRSGALTGLMSVALVGHREGLYMPAPSPLV